MGPFEVASPYHGIPVSVVPVRFQGHPSVPSFSLAAYGWHSHEQLPIPAPNGWLPSTAEKVSCSWLPLESWTLGPSRAAGSTLKELRQLLSGCAGHRHQLIQETVGISTTTLAGEKESYGKVWKHHHLLWSKKSLQT